MTNSLRVFVQRVRSVTCKQPLLQWSKPDVAIDKFDDVISCASLDRDRGSHRDVAMSNTTQTRFILQT